MFSLDTIFGGIFVFLLLYWALLYYADKLHNSKK